MNERPWEARLVRPMCLIDADPSGEFASERREPRSGTVALMAAMTAANERED